ncbi:MAG: 30S ribosomal protein S13 [Candidatus Methanomethylicota archaeon]|uniref:Small ribosomal subunit protein uS13 n=1 Tax=Thermoproteota archaeon TaxID=2056631 RepID=A0A497F917_9CREN|nr:MAG: 30S ribosomal protein S13 [Candidatus Verstraetearchaeota archaeon]RLE55749.1 MAG: 30S ribosomal protein S13 [Candidatus Verstraetearchaeota archaeon]
MAFRHIVRIAGQDVDGSKKVVYAISQIKGIGINLAHAIVRVVGVDPDVRVGFLSEADIKRIESAIRNIRSQGIPRWMFNRRKDLETGEDIHLIGSDLALRVKADIDLMKKIKCWKGVRHALGLKVRGQKTRTTGRSGQTVGVSRKPRR